MSKAACRAAAWVGVRPLLPLLDPLEGALMAGWAAGGATAGVAAADPPVEADACGMLGMWAGTEAAVVGGDESPSIWST